MVTKIAGPGAAPPAPLATNNVYRVRLLGQVADCVTVNVFYYADDAGLGTATRADLLEVGTVFAGAGHVYEAFHACVSAAWKADVVKVDCPTSPTLMEAEIDIGGIPGAVPGDALPNAMCVTLIKRTLLRGKRGRGRLSVPGVPLSSTLGSSVVVLDGYVTLTLRMEATLPGATKTYRPGLFAETFTEPPGPGLRQTFVNMSTVTINSVLGTCRRRKPGVGI